LPVTAPQHPDTHRFALLAHVHIAPLPAAPLSSGNRNGVVLLRLVAKPEAKMLAVVDRLIKQPGDVIVVQGVDGGLAVPGADDKAEVPKQAELMGHGGLFHTDIGGEPGHGAGLAAQPRQDKQPAWRRQRLHGLRD
jgi:hypothetical protein